MRKRYVVDSMVDGKMVTEGFTKPGMDSLKRLDMVKFYGATNYENGVVYHYRPKQILIKEK